MENVKKKSPALQSAIVGGKLLLICAIVAAIMAFVYQLTLAKYEENLQETKNQAVEQIFGQDGLRCEELYTDGDTGAVVYRVLRESGDVEGYCAESVAPGFGGDLSVMVGYRADLSILGVSVVSMSETPGLGSKVGEAAYLDGYEGKTGELTLGKEVDAISGATISSKALLSAVNQATDALQKAVTGIMTIGGDAS